MFVRVILFDVKKEFGKWLMDIAKYLTTAVVLANIFSDMQEKSIIFIGGLSILTALSVGLYLVKEPEKRVKRKKR